MRMIDRIAVVVATLALAAAAGCDNMNKVDGERGPCGFGGDLSGCPPSELTPEGACTRLVDCAAIPLDGKMQGGFDWGHCVDQIDGMTADRRTFVIDCVATSTCDALKSSDSPANGGQPFCFNFGAN
jgi:hypothetical protein